jgi:hypothetical protein
VLYNANMAGIGSFGVTGPWAIGGFLAMDDADARNYTREMWVRAKKGLEQKRADFLPMYPNAHFMINLDGTFKDDREFRLPDGYDWFGLECYGRLGMDVGACKTRFDALMRVIPANGRVWILLPTVEGYGPDSLLASNAAAIYDWARSEGRIIGLIGFVWQGELMLPFYERGARDLPILRQVLTRIGREITGRTQSGCNLIS